MKRGTATILILAALILLIALSQEYLFTDATSQEVGQAITIRPAEIVTVSIRDIVDTPVQIEEEMYYDSLELLAICVEAEAGNQSMEGKRLVAAVILNRVEDPDFPDTITEVIEQEYHFSTYWNGAMDRVWEPSEETYAAVAAEVEHRSNTEVLYFTAGGYGEYGTPWRKVGDHYFCTK